MDNKRHRQCLRGRRNTVSGPPSSTTSVTCQDEPLSVRSHSPDRMSSTTSSSSSSLPNIKRRSKSVLGFHENEMSQNLKSLPLKDTSSSTTDEKGYDNIRQSSKSLSSSQSPSSSNERLSETTNRLLHRQRRLSEITTPHNIKTRNDEKLFFTKFNSQQKPRQLSDARNPHRRDSLPPLKLPVSQSQAGYRLAGKYYKQWRDGRKKKVSLSSNSSSSENVIKEEDQQISLQKNVIFSPEFEKVFNALIIHTSSDEK